MGFEGFQLGTIVSSATFLALPRCWPDTILDWRQLNHKFSGTFCAVTCRFGYFIPFFFGKFTSAFEYRSEDYGKVLEIFIWYVSFYYFLQLK